jgi:hypothetical protein
MRVRVTVGIDEDRGPALADGDGGGRARFIRRRSAARRARRFQSYGSDADARTRQTELADLVGPRAVRRGRGSRSTRSIAACVRSSTCWSARSRPGCRRRAAHRIIADGRRMFAPLASRFPTRSA